MASCSASTPEYPKAGAAASQLPNRRTSSRDRRRSSPSRAFPVEPRWNSPARKLPRLLLPRQLRSCRPPCSSPLYRLPSTAPFAPDARVATHTFLPFAVTADADGNLFAATVADSDRVDHRIGFDVDHDTASKWSFAHITFRPSGVTTTPVGRLPTRTMVILCRVPRLITDRLAEDWLRHRLCGRPASPLLPSENCRRGSW